MGLSLKNGVMMNRKIDEQAWEERLSYISKIHEKMPQTLKEVYEAYSVTPEEEEQFKMKADERQVGGSHYKELGVQPWSVMEAILSREEFIGFLKGNIIKYSMRQGRKDSDDAAKCQHYIEKLQEIENAFGRF
jgi:hypothetical protein